MPLIKTKPFERQHLEKTMDSVTLRLNKEEREQLNKDKLIIEQSKDGTAIKTLMNVGSIVLHDKKMRYILATLFKNKRNNRRSGIVEFE